MLSQYEFSSRALKALAYQKIDAAIREALQVLEHAELVYITVDSDRPTNGPPPVLDWRHWPAVKTLSGSTSQSGRIRVAAQADCLQELDNLRSTGVISEAKYNTKRGQIIDEI